jgi:hypothetical protein
MVGIVHVAGLGKGINALRLGHGTFKESNGGGVGGVALAEEVEWCASLGITEQRVGPMEEEEINDACSRSARTIEATSRMESRALSRLFINAGNDTVILQEELHTIDPPLLGTPHQDRAFEHVQHRRVSA